MKGRTLKVVDSEHGKIPVGTVLTVEKENVNQFSGRETITVSADPSPESRLGRIQFQVTDTKDVLREIVVGRESDQVVVRSC